MKQLIDRMTAEHKPKPLNIKSPFNALHPCKNCVPQTLSSSWLDEGEGWEGPGHKELSDLLKQGAWAGAKTIASLYRLPDAEATGESGHAKLRSPRHSLRFFFL